MMPIGRYEKVIVLSSSIVGTPDPVSALPDIRVMDTLTIGKGHDISSGIIAG